MAKVLIIGCGGVANVAIHKCCQNSEVFSEICIASRTKSQVRRGEGGAGGQDQNQNSPPPRWTRTRWTRWRPLSGRYKPDLVMNIALPYQDLAIMDACLASAASTIWTPPTTSRRTWTIPQWRAAYEKRCQEEGFSAYFDYSWQWAYQEKFEKAGLTALLGTGFDPGVTQAYCAYAQKHLFDEIDTIDILDCNGGDHGYPFATNFNPEVNLREVSAPGSYWEDGRWVEIRAHEHQAGIRF